MKHLIATVLIFTLTAGAQDGCKPSSAPRPNLTNQEYDRLIDCSKKQIEEFKRDWPAMKEAMGQGSEAKVILRSFLNFKGSAECNRQKWVSAHCIDIARATMLTMFQMRSEYGE